LFYISVNKSLILFKNLRETDLTFANQDKIENSEKDIFNVRDVPIISLLNIGGPAEIQPWFYLYVVMLVVLYGCETFVSDIREGGSRLSVLEDRVLRKIFGANRNGGWINLSNQGLLGFYFSPTIIGIMKSKRMGWVGYLARKGENKTPYRSMVGKPTGKRRQGITRLGSWIILRWIL
jgi:hypothetical protein